MIYSIDDVWVGKPAAAGGKFIQVLPRAGDRCAIRVVVVVLLLTMDNDNGQWTMIMIHGP